MRRVFVVWSHALFHQSVRMLLDHPQLTIVGDAQSIDAVQAELEELHPDTIIVEVPEDDACAGVFHLTQDCPWNPRLVCVSLQNNTVQIYRRQQLTLEEAHDLLHLVLDE